MRRFVAWIVPAQRRYAEHAAVNFSKERLMVDHVPQVGAPDPELKTSPIFDEYEEISLDLELEAGACYFNNVAYPIGQYVTSGSELLQCEGRGVWVRKGEKRPVASG